MDYGKLNRYFLGIGAKRLSEVEVTPEVSNQHEFNGISGFKNMFGIERISFQAKYLYLNDEDSNIEDTGELTWYDARENHATRTEFRLYYSSSEVINRSNPGDLLVICRVSENELYIIVAAEGTTSERQVLWLFGLENIGNIFEFKDFSKDNIEIGYAASHILSSIGIEVETAIDNYLEILLERFGAKFPKTKEFSEYARSATEGVQPRDNPDAALIKWLEQEEMLFKTLEKHIVKNRLKEGFGVDGTDVDEFISFSLSVQNRRKSRAGHAFENHLSELFFLNDVRYSRGAKTERKNKPDFLFPGISEYSNPSFSTELLTMLGVKTSAKDRWRQVLSEADRIVTKHLITLQPSISENQTDEMKAQNLVLVVPDSILPSFSSRQQSDILNVRDFITLVRNRQG